MTFLILGVVVFALLLVFGAPIFMAMVCGGAVMLLLGLGMPPEMVAQKLVTNIDVFTFMAIAPFILAGNLMTHGGASRALVDMMESFVGRLPGGLGMVAVLSCALFAAMCGSTIATSAAVGAMLLAPMVEKGYPKGFICALIATAGTIGIMIPPSINMVIYGGIAEESVPALFMAGFIPGIMLTAMLAGMTVFLSRGKGYVSGRSFTWRDRGQAVLRSLPAIGMIAVIMVPIYTGLATPTEAAALSVVYGFLIGRFYYRGLTWQGTREAIIDATRTTAMLLVIIASGLLFGAGLVAYGAAEVISNFAVQAGLNWWQFLLMINVIWLLLGFVMESTSVMVIMVPLILKAFAPLGISRVHFGILGVLNTELALITPPVGINLYVMSAVGKVPVDTVIRNIWPFVAVLFVGLLIITYFPNLSLFLPTAMGLIK